MVNPNPYISSLSRLCRGRDFCFKSLLDWEVVQKGIGRQQQTVHLFREKVGLMVKCTPERGQKCSLFHLMVKCTPIIVELPSVYRGCKPLICFQ